MKTFVLKVFIVNFISTFITAEELSGERSRNQTQDRWTELRQLASIKVASSDARSSRAISPIYRYNSYNSQCPGTVVTLSPGDATIVDSHKNYGKDPYPSDYKVSNIKTYHRIS